MKDFSKTRKNVAPGHAPGAEGGASKRSTNGASSPPASRLELLMYKAVREFDMFVEHSLG